jgi:ubiquinone/menaquinone biosynthesis C-methylase UbiE
MTRHGHKFDPAHRDHLLEPERARYLPAKAILSKFPMKVGGAAVDIGCGPGYWTIPMAKLIGPSGRVYAVDLEETMLATLRTRVERYRDLNIQVLRSTEDRLPLPARSVDFAFLACVLHELEGPGTLREAARVLRPGGILGIVEWKKIRQLEGPPYRHRLSPAQAAKVL